MSTFDAEAFMNSTVDAPLATDYENCPEGEYQAMIDTFEMDKAVKSFDFTYKKGERAGQPGTMDIFEIPFIIQDPAVQQKLGREKVVVRGKCTLDWLNGQRGQLDYSPGKNILLGQTKAAVGQNVPGIPIRALAGAGPVMVRVAHRQDDKNPERKYAEVVRVAPIR